jgi:probable phosphoglycerate mutase
MMRHGEAENNVIHTLAGRRLEFHLTEKGKLQVADVAHKLKAIHVDQMYTSPVTRAVETSKIVSKEIGIDYKIDERLTETEMGSIAGMSYDGVLEKHGNLFNKFYGDDEKMSRDVGVERFSAIGARIDDMLDYVAEKHPDKNVLLVTHLDPIKSTISKILDLKPDAIFKMVIRNASLTVLRHGSTDYTLLAFNVMDISRYNSE